MSQVTNPTLSARGQLRAHWLVALSALLALLATAAVVLVLAIDDGPSGIGNSAAVHQPAAGPEESAVAAAISRSGPVTQYRSGGPDESTVGMSISRTAAVPQYRTGGPDESAVASAVSGR